MIFFNFKLNRMICPIFYLFIINVLFKQHLIICEGNKVTGISHNNGHNDNLKVHKNGVVSQENVYDSSENLNLPSKKKVGSDDFHTTTISFTEPDSLENEVKVVSSSESGSGAPVSETQESTEGSSNTQPSVVSPLPSSQITTQKESPSNPTSGSPPATVTGEQNSSVSQPSSPNPSPTERPSGETPSSPQTLNKAAVPEIPIQITSALLKNYNGVKVTGPCGAYFRVYLVPHILIYALTKYSVIQLESLFNDNPRIDVEHTGALQNKCSEGKHFKLVVYITHDTLTLKWKTHNPKEETKSDVVDIRKYRIPTLERPFTSIQVYTANPKAGLIETKNYNIRTDIPDTCDTIATDCFLNGNVNIEKCFQCTLLVQKKDKSHECFKYVSKEMKKKMNEIKVKAEDDSNSDEYKLIESIDNILSKIYKKSNEPFENSKELISFEDLDYRFKNELLEYCNLLKKVDTSGTLESYELGNEEDIYNNLTRLLRSHSDENVLTLQGKLRNTAICIKNVDEWILNKRGLTLPSESDDYLNNYNDNDKKEDQDSVDNNMNEDFNYDDQNNNDSNKKDDESNKNDDAGNYVYDFDDDDYDNNNYETDMYEDSIKADKDGVIDLEKFGNQIKLRSPYFKNSKYCNYEYCNRWRDKTSCISQIEVEEQGNCGLCWVFASKLHIETIRCMRGYGHYRSSALYVANCSKRKPIDRCEEGSNPLEFLRILDEKKFLPLESNYPYSYTNAGNSCPKIQNSWTNLWGDTKLLFNKKIHRYIGNKGFISHETSYFKDNMDLFIDMVKREVQNKGSVIVYIKTQDVIGYDFNGKGVHSMCGDRTPDHAANIIGYGNYINKKGEKRSYWLIRNSWSYYWGDEGNFRVDMLGPKHCLYNFIHTVVFFKLDLGAINVPKKKFWRRNIYFLRHNPDFMYTLYYNNYEPESSQNYISDDNYENAFVHGQSDETEKTDLKGQDVKKSVEKKIQILHILKHINNSQVKRGLVKYDNLNETKDEHSCSRVNSEDPDKYEECKQFCLTKWNECKDHYSPGYCLTDLYKEKHCNFCYV
ncbi:serine repeat antigen 6, putative [Plasmodium sp. gorilla clade G2]|uniref:serine repeat antigen 6, putative n=1 Tax=Plasmodium sp. gorilla clade G2 TaxID=880535 RepID=UPI000D2DD50A|nr:serine repeat antigen 6, putative [Plasmodium sp. gorilla clade G2]SOV20074.1 serine repeat antigen 6, putative [Plasmodium sp. gorilla clade G2]